MTSPAEIQKLVQAALPAELRDAARRRAEQEAAEEAAREQAGTEYKAAESERAELAKRWHAAAADFRRSYLALKSAQGKLADIVDADWQAHRRQESAALVLGGRPGIPPTLPWLGTSVASAECPFLAEIDAALVSAHR